LRSCEDLKSTAPDVKGGTPRPEGHMQEGMNILHGVDPAHIQGAPANIPRHTRAFITVGVVLMGATEPAVAIARVFYD
jgi:hypothetical protein